MRSTQYMAYGRIGLSVMVLFAVVFSASAVETWKVSDYNGASQIWFEAEAFDERSPEEVYKLRAAETNLKLDKGAFGDAITNPQGRDGGYLLYRFDISTAGGKGGTWYFWGRIINPSNKSDWLWILGEDGDKIPQKKPNVFGNATHRIFEANVGPPWAWDGGTREGHRRELQDGENVMMIWWRQSDSSDQWDVFMWTDSDTYIPTDDDYKNAEEYVLTVKPGGKLTTSWGRLKSR